MLFDNDEIGNRQLGEEYFGHEVFVVLEDIVNFYDFLSDNSFRFLGNSLITTLTQNLDTSVYDAICGTVESIMVVLKNGRINDAYSLLRKYDDTIMVDTYKSIVLERENKHFVTELMDENKDFLLKTFAQDSKIRAWVKFAKKLYNQNQDMAKEIGKNPMLSDVTKLIKEVDSNSFNKKRQTCNNNVHYNSWGTFILNNFRLIRSTNIWKGHLKNIQETVIQFFALHFCYIYILHPEYYVASDYVDYLDRGLTPPEGIQNKVANYIQKMFDKYIKPNYPDAAEYLLDIKNLKLQ